MSYSFDVPCEPDLKITTPEPGKIHLEFIHEEALFNLTEQLGHVETLILRALGYGN